MLNRFMSDTEARGLKLIVQTLLSLFILGPYLLRLYKQSLQVIDTMADVEHITLKAKNTTIKDLQLEALRRLSVTAKLKKQVKAIDELRRSKKKVDKTRYIALYEGVKEL